MINELMKLTLLLCIVVGPILFVGEIVLARIRRTACRSLRNIYVDPAYAALLHAKANMQGPARPAPQADRGSAEGPANAAFSCFTPRPTTDAQ